MALGFTALALGINKFVLVKLKLLVHVEYYERETIGGDIVPAPQDDEYKEIQRALFTNLICIHHCKHS